jgi:MFS family permease
LRRFATTLAFFANGALFASVLPHLPAIKERVALDDPALGAAVAAASAGALVAGLVAGQLTTRFGAGAVVVTGTLAYCALLSAPALAPSFLVLAAVFALFGALDAVIDVAMNTMALALQRDRGRSMINTFHAWWSIGAVTASAAAAMATSAGAPVPVTLAAAGIVIASATLAVAPSIRRATGGPVTVVREAAAGGRRGRPWRRMLLLGMVALLAAFAEDVPSTWSAVFVEDELDASAGLAAGGYVAFVGAMTVGRFVNDRLVERFGGRTVVRVQATILAVAMVTAAASSRSVVAIAAFAAAGLGVSSLFPTLVAAAGRDGQHSTAGNLAYVSWVERFGFLAAPALVGGLSGLTNLRFGMLLGALAGIALVLLAGSFVDRDSF